MHLEYPASEIPHMSLSPLQLVILTFLQLRNRFFPTMTVMDLPLCRILIHCKTGRRRHHVPHHPALLGPCMSPLRSVPWPWKVEKICEVWVQRWWYHLSIVFFWMQVIMYSRELLIQSRRLTTWYFTVRGGVRRHPRKQCRFLLRRQSCVGRCSFEFFKMWRNM